MQQTWAIQLEPSARDALASARLCDGVCVATIDGALWVCGDERQPLETVVIQGLPAVQRFRVIDGGVLVRAGSRVPCGKLPEAFWEPIARACSVTPPRTALPGRLTQRCTLALSRVGDRRGDGLGDVAAAPNVIRTRIDVLARAVDALPAFRIEPWRFAANGRGEAIVIGEPAPSLPGVAYHMEHGIALPLGYALSPLASRAALRGWLDLAEDDCVLVEPNGDWRRIAGEAFIPAARAAIRRTAEAYGPTQRSEVRDAGA